MPTTKQISILIVDDHPIVCEGIAAILERHSGFSVAGMAYSGREAVGMVAELEPDVILMDLNMPEMDGVEAIRLIHEVTPQSAILILTTYAGDADIVRGLKAGARGYLLKDSEAEELILAIESISEGQMCIQPEIAATLAEHVADKELTDREVEVLQLIACGMSNQAIAESLFISTGTVKTHVNSILSKLDANDRTHASIIAIRRGIIRLPD